jgi:hypothetical protein
MHDDSAKNVVALKSLNVLCNIEFILGIPCIFPMFEIMHMLIKIAQGRNVFVYDFVGSIKLIKHQLYNFYCDPYANFEDIVVNYFNSIESMTSQALPMNWFYILNGGKMLNILRFFLLEVNTLFVGVDVVGNFLPITKDDFKKVVIKMKDECEGVVCNLIF